VTVDRYAALAEFVATYASKASSQRTAYALDVPSADRVN
jgi:hypothetical protein